MSLPLFKRVKESRTGSNYFVVFLSLKRKQTITTKNTIETFFHKVNYRKRWLFFFKEAFNWKVLTVHVPYWISENGRPFCLDPEEVSSNAEHSWSSTRSVTEIFIDPNNTLIQFIFLLLQPKATAYFIDIRTGIITKKKPKHMDRFLFCFVF